MSLHVRVLNALSRRDSVFEADIDVLCLLLLDCATHAGVRSASFSVLAFYGLADIDLLDIEHGGLLSGGLRGERCASHELRFELSNASTLILNLAGNGSHVASMIARAA
eukprot:6492384-Amphidinium_carterae.4